MESSFGLVFRALVMLACLAVVPLLGLYGKYIPDFVQSVVEAYKARTQAKETIDPRAAAGGEAPRFAGGTARTGSQGGSSSTTTTAPGAWPNPDQPARPLPVLRQPGQFDSARASFNEPADPGTSAEAPARTSTQGPAGSNVALAPDPAGGDGQTAPADNCTAQFRRMEQRLRELGATYYLLETWGSSGDRYRFFCKMAIAGNADYNRNRIFQATAADPLRAMQDVLAQVEQWRSGGTQ